MNTEYYINDHTKWWPGRSRSWDIRKLLIIVKIYINNMNSKYPLRCVTGHGSQPAASNDKLIKQ